MLIFMRWGGAKKVEIFQLFSYPLSGCLKLTSPNQEFQTMKFFYPLG